MWDSRNQFSTHRFLWGVFHRTTLPKSCNPTDDITHDVAHSSTHLGAFRSNFVPVTTDQRTPLPQLRRGQKTVRRLHFARVCGRRAIRRTSVLLYIRVWSHPISALVELSSPTLAVHSSPWFSLIGERTRQLLRTIGQQLRLPPPPASRGDLDG